MTDTLDPPVPPVAGPPAGRRRPHRAGRHPAGDAALLHRLRDERDRRPGAAAGRGRAQAGAPARAVLDGRERLPAGPALRQVRPRRRRGDGQLPPARRQLDLRRAGPAGPAVVAALPVDRRPGQLRLAGQRPTCRDEVLRRCRWPSPVGRRLLGADRRHRPGCCAALGQPGRSQGARPQRRPGARRDAVPLRPAPDAARLHGRGLRADGHAQPPGAVPGGRAGDSDAAVEAAGGGPSGRPGGAAADADREWCAAPGT